MVQHKANAVLQKLSSSVTTTYLYTIKTLELVDATIRSINALILARVHASYEKSILYTILLALLYTLYVLFKEGGSRYTFVFALAWGFVATLAGDHLVTQALGLRWGPVNGPIAVIMNSNYLSPLLAYVWLGLAIWLFTWVCVKIAEMCKQEKVEEREVFEIPDARSRRGDDKMFA
ncbi:hypothetical protein BDV96DRAFT_601156 [Lophiotrema nucula]|uniref:Uncharacterized protein n=1 Tax=Lophiotrema nucula TaxID=690887 RepID=A0A6A5Z2M3_9PLEO|nr:hypothetical protein BDV96DRAFT_601156 [Lophiotrema nucula]